MKKVWGISVGVMFVLSLLAGGCATDQEKRTVERTRVEEITATVEKIDVEKRLVTLRMPMGNVLTLNVDERVRNLPQVKVGDQVVVKYYESLAVRMAEPGDPMSTSTSGVTSAKPGEMPAGVAAKQVTITATVQAINRKEPAIALMGPGGDVVTVRVLDPKNLEKVKVGDKLLITYTESLAISVERVGK
jgi:hypothetical protein